MRVEAVVMRVEDRLAWVKVLQDAAGCGRCNEPGGCRSEMLGEVLGKRCREYAVDNDLQAPCGAHVSIEVSEGLPLKAAALAYGLPLLSVLLGAAAARVLTHSDAAGAMGAAIGLLLAWWAMKRFGKRLAANGLKPRLVEILK